MLQIAVMTTAGIDDQVISAAVAELLELKYATTTPGSLIYDHRDNQGSATSFGNRCSSTTGRLIDRQCYSNCQAQVASSKDIQRYSIFNVFLLFMLYRE
ncbi:MAG: hypothetical protein QW733_06375 [Desulfurococcaceae archaeon]